VNPASVGVAPSLSPPRFQPSPVLCQVSGNYNPEWNLTRIDGNSAPANYYDVYLTSLPCPAPTGRGHSANIVRGPGPTLSGGAAQNPFRLRYLRFVAPFFPGPRDLGTPGVPVGLRPAEYP